MLIDFSEKNLPQVEKEMLEYIEENTLSNSLKKSMSYSVTAGGKRLRPLIVLAVADAFQQELTTPFYQVAASLEMVHTYSLIHDDLPAMDNDDLRRGKPTNHKVYGEALAILAGDGLLTMAFQLLSEVNLASDEKLLLLQLLTKASGTSGMVSGQVGDIEAENKAVSLADLKQIHSEKTGALLTYAFMAGGILAQQTPEILNTLQRLGKHIGLAFQIRDDLLDVVGTTEDLGKNVHQDQKLAKSTYPNLLGLNGAKKALENELVAAEKVIQALAGEPDFNGSILNEIVALLKLEEA